MTARPSIDQVIAHARRQATAAQAHTNPTDRLLACWGQGVVLAGCDWCNVEGTCEPIPWRGRPDVWRWEP